MIQDDPRTVRRYRVKDAAVLLGVSTQAIRHRIRRGTLDSEKDDGGLVWVLLDPATVSAAYPPDGPHNSPGDSPQDGPADHPLLELVEILREQLAAAEARERRSDERERELRRIIAGLVQRVPELPSGDSPQNVRSDERDEPQNASEEADRGTTTPPHNQGEPRRSWWSKLFGLE